MLQEGIGRNIINKHVSMQIKTQKLLFLKCLLLKITCVT